MKLEIKNGLHYINGCFVDEDTFLEVESLKVDVDILSEQVSDAHAQIKELQTGENPKIEKLDALVTGSLRRCP